MKSNSQKQIKRASLLWEIALYQLPMNLFESWLAFFHGVVIRATSLKEINDTSEEELYELWCSTQKPLVISK